MNFQKLGPNVPQDGNVISKALGRFLLKILGWKVEGEFPNISKVMIIFAPHISYWDGIFLVLTRVALGINASWLGKSSLFFFPLGILIRKVGGIPTERDKSEGRVKKIADKFRQRDSLVLVIAPEGTRSKVSRWKTGFYNIANEAKLPILLMYLDYSRKVIGFGKVMNPTGDYDKDISDIKEYYQPYIIKSKNK